MIEKYIRFSYFSMIIISEHAVFILILVPLWFDLEHSATWFELIRSAFTVRSLFFPPTKKNEAMELGLSGKFEKKASTVSVALLMSQVKSIIIEIITTFVTPRDSCTPWKKCIVLCMPSNCGIPWGKNYRITHCKEYYLFNLIQDKTGLKTFFLEISNLKE